jgi:hypothetical protein
MIGVMVSLGIGVAVVVTSPSVAFADPADTPHDSTGTAYATPAQQQQFQATFHLAPGASGPIGTAQNPPGGGCYFDDAHGSFNWFFTNHVLTNVQATYGSSITCTTTVPGQSMGLLSSRANLFHNGQPAASAPAGTCLNCNQISSSSPYSCVGQANCAGSYWIGGVQLMQLPAPWIWTSWPERCTASTDQTALQCIALSTVVTIPPTG